MRDRLEIWQGDITTLDVDAIVNAANEQLLPGGGVCGAIHAGAGPELARACAAVSPCPTGEAKLTPGFLLAARYVLHAVGPVWHGGTKGEEALLAGCYRHCLALAQREDLESVAFPAISTGIFGYPLDDACRVAVATVTAYLREHDRPERVVLCAFGADAVAALERAAR